MAVRYRAAQHPKSLRDLVKNQATELEVVSATDLPDFSNEYNIVAVLVKSEGDNTFYTDSVLFDKETYPLAGEKYTFSNDDVETNGGFPKAN